MKNEFMKCYKEIKKSEGNSVAFTELEYFLRELTKTLSSEEAYNLCLCLLSKNEIKEIE